MKKIIAIILCAVMLTFSLTSCGSKAPYDKSETETNLVLIDVEGKGQIVVELYPDVAPITVANFKKLVSQGFYDGLIFHRVIENFMIQGGCPEGTGLGGKTDANGNRITIKGEFSSNGVKNDLDHTRGVISMARSQLVNSASSQFFICHQDAAHLDGKYAAFGKVTDGMDVVDAIAAVETNSNDKPLEDVVITSITFAQ